MIRPDHRTTFEIAVAFVPFPEPYLTPPLSQWLVQLKSVTAEGSGSESEWYVGSPEKILVSVIEDVRTRAAKIH